VEFYAYQGKASFKLNEVLGSDIYTEVLLTFTELESEIESMVPKDALMHLVRIL